MAKIRALIVCLSALAVCGQGFDLNERYIKMYSPQIDDSEEGWAQTWSDGWVGEWVDSAEMYSGGGLDRWTMKQALLLAPHSQRPVISWLSELTDKRNVFGEQYVKAFTAVYRIARKLSNEKYQRKILEFLAYWGQVKFRRCVKDTMKRIHRVLNRRVMREDQSDLVDLLTTALSMGKTYSDIDFYEKLRKMDLLNDKLPLEELDEMTFDSHTSLAWRIESLFVQSCMPFLEALEYHFSLLNIVEKFDGRNRFDTPELLKLNEIFRICLQVVDGDFIRHLRHLTGEPDSDVGENSTILEEMKLE